MESVKVRIEGDAIMNINEYQKLAMTTLNPELSQKDVLINGVMGLCGESGEVIDLVKKHLAQGHELDKEKMIKELGDVAWYLAETAYALDVDLETVLVRNIEKQTIEKKFLFTAHGLHIRLINPKSPYIFSYKYCTISTKWVSLRLSYDYCPKIKVLSF